jgi:hypothetical protein
MAKLSHTSQTAIAITFLVMNLSTWLRRVFSAFLCQKSKTTPVYRLLIIFYYLWTQFNQFQLMSATALNSSLIFLSRSRTYSASPILEVKDTQATRSGIITAFEEHLIKQAKEEEENKGSS